jgi:hypothetical protein
MSTYLYLNRNLQKTSCDRITVRKNGPQVSVCYMDGSDDNKKGTHTTYSIMDFYQYMNNLLDFLQVDTDAAAFQSLDVLIPGYPVVCLDFRDNRARELLLRTLYSWLLQV